MTPSRISRPNVRVRPSSIWARSRPSSWVRVNSSTTSMIAWLPCRVTGALLSSQARWLGWSSATTDHQAASRSVCC